MTASVYEAVAFAMRYWFIIAMAVILIAVVSASVKEYRSRKYVIKRMEEFLGYLEIVGGPEDLIGTKFGICDENIIGSSSRSDIIIEDKSVKKAHAILYRRGDSLLLSTVNKSETYVNDRPAERAYTLKTGDIISVGNVDMCIFIKRKRVGDDY